MVTNDIHNHDKNYILQEEGWDDAFLQIRYYHDTWVLIQYVLQFDAIFFYGYGITFVVVFLFGADGPKFFW